MIASLSAAEFQPTYDLAKLPGTAPDAPDIKFYGEPSPSGSQFGNVVRTGDFNGDGIQDLAIADPFVERSAPFRALVGAVYVWFGRTGFAAKYDARGVAGPAPDVKILGANQGDRVGFDAAFEVGDFNGDGVDDLVLGASQASDPSRSRQYCGIVYVVFGRKAPDQLPGLIDLVESESGGADITIIGPADFAALSKDYAIRLADVNGDAVQDLILGAQFANRTPPSATGEAYVLYGHRKPDAYRKIIDLAKVGTSEGADVTLRGVTGWDLLTSDGAITVGDVNGDQLPDIVVGAPGGEILEFPDRHGGRVCVIFGRGEPVGLPSFIDLSKEGFGGADVTIIGGYSVPVGQTDDPDRLSGTGLQVADINGDRLADLIMGSLHGVYVVLGRNSLPPFLDVTRTDKNGPDLHLAESSAIRKHFRSALGVGDFNGDQIADIVLANPVLQSKLGKDEAGQALVVLGNPNAGGSVKFRDLDADEPAAVDIRVYGADESDQLTYGAFGNSPGRGDVNGDQIDDLVLVSVGAAGPGDGRPRGGEAYLLFGKANPDREVDLAQPAEPGGRVVIFGPYPFSEFLRSGDRVIRRPGVRVADINGDGVGDLILGNGGAATPFGELNRPNTGEVYVILGIRTTAQGPEIGVEDPEGLALASGDGRAFGLVAVGGNKSLTFTIRNLGASVLNGIGVSLDGTDSSSFAVTAAPAGSVDGPLGTTPFTIQFRPDSPGLKSAILRLASNDADENPFNILLSGTGVDPTPPTASIRISAVEICWNSIPGLRYQPEVGPSADGPWSPAGPPVTASLPTTCISDAAGEAPKFYRITPLIP